MRWVLNARFWRRWHANPIFIGPICSRGLLWSLFSSTPDIVVDGVHQPLWPIQLYIHTVTFFPPFFVIYSPVQLLLPQASQGRDIKRRLGTKRNECELWDVDHEMIETSPTVLNTLLSKWTRTISRARVYWSAIVTLIDSIDIFYTVGQRKTNKNRREKGSQMVHRQQ